MLTPSISEANQNPGSQTGSQQRQTPGDAGRHPEKVSPGSWLFRRHQATSRGGKMRLTSGPQVRTLLRSPS